MVLPKWRRNICHSTAQITTFTQLSGKVSQQAQQKELHTFGGWQKLMDTLPIIYSAGAVSNKGADVEQGACPWRYLLIDVMCVFMEA